MKTPLGITSQALETWYSKRENFWGSVSAKEKEIIANVQSLMDNLPEILKTSNSIEEVQNLYVDLNSWLEPLGELCAKSITEKLAIDEYIEESKAKKYVDVKQALSDEGKRATVSQIEATLDGLHSEDEWLMLFLTERHKIYQAKLEAGKNYLDGINNKIIWLRQEYSRTIQQERNSTFKPQT